MPIPHTTETIELPNGISVLLIDAPSAPVIAYAIHFRSGPDEATRAYPYQTAHTLEHIVEAGPDEPQYQKKAQYLQEIQKNGAWRNAYTGEFGINYIGDCTPEEILRILDLRLSAIEKPKFTQTLLQSESGNVMEEMRQRVTDYTRLAGALSRKVLAEGAWLTSKEAMADASEVTLEKVHTYHSRTHTTDNMKFTIVGNIDHVRNSIIELLSSSKLPRGKALVGPATLPAAIDAYTYEARPSLESIFTNFTLALPRQLSSKEIATMRIVNNLLCNSWDSRILGQAREMGLCYSMNGYIEMSKTQSMWRFDTPISPTNAPRFFALMSKALSGLGRDGGTDTEIKKAKALLIGQSRKNGQTAQALLNMYSHDYFGLDAIVTDEDRIALLSSVTRQDIASLVDEFISSKSRIFGGVGSIVDTDFKGLCVLLSKGLDNHISSPT